MVPQPKTNITREYPADWKRGGMKSLPKSRWKRTTLCLPSTKKTLAAKKNDKVIFCDLAYKYYDTRLSVPQRRSKWVWLKETIIYEILLKRILAWCQRKRTQEIARNDVSIRRSEGYPWSLSVDNWYVMSPQANAARRFWSSLWSTKFKGR